MAVDSIMRKRRSLPAAEKQRKISQGDNLHLNFYFCYSINLFDSMLPNSISRHIYSFFSRYYYIFFNIYIYFFKSSMAHFNTLSVNNLYLIHFSVTASTCAAQRESVRSGMAACRKLLVAWQLVTPLVCHRNYLLSLVLKLLAKISNVSRQLGSLMWM